MEKESNQTILNQINPLSRTEKMITFKYQKKDFCIFQKGLSGNYICPFVEEDYADGYCTTYRCMIDKKRAVRNESRCRISCKNDLEGMKLITEIKIEE